MLREVDVGRRRIIAKEEEELQSVLDDYQSSTGATTQLGALLKEKFNRE